MKINSEAEMLEFGRQFAARLTLPAVIELVGDVGVGKTTFTRGLAEGLGVQEPVTSPSFTISKRYAFVRPNMQSGDARRSDTPSATVNEPSSAIGELAHYDFYRLNDPGIMRDELSETIALPNTVVVVEWGGDVADLLPSEKYHLEITLNEGGSRTVTEERGSTR